MNNIYDEERLGRLIRQTYEPVVIPPGMKELIRERILKELSNDSEKRIGPWARPKVMVPILASIAGALIAYGFWISKSFV